MQAILLVGGRGTRLSSLYADRPKALVPVAGRPFLERQVELLVRSGIRRIHLAAGHLADQLAEWLRERGTAEAPDRFRWGGAQVSISREPAPLGTGGGLKFIEPWIETDPFLVLNGDSLLPRLDFPMFGKNEAEFSKQWEKTGVHFPNIGQCPPGWLAVTRIEEAGRYGTVDFDKDGRVLAFREKAQREGGWVNGGVYLLSRVLLSAIEPGRSLSLETDIFPAWAAAGLLRAFRAPPPLLDMGTPEGLSAMSAFFAAH